MFVATLLAAALREGKGGCVRKVTRGYGSVLGSVVLRLLVILDGLGFV